MARAAQPRAGQARPQRSVGRVRETSPWRVALAGMVAIAVAMGIGRFAYTPILPGMMEELSLSASGAGLIASANYLGYLLGAIAAGGSWAAGREASLSLWALLASGLLCAAMALTDSVAVFALLRFVAGIASAFVLVFASTLVLARLAQAGRSDLQALHFGGVGIGIVLSAATIAALVADHDPWQASWLAAAALSLIGVAAYRALRGPAPAAAGQAPKEGALEFSPALVKLIIAYGLFGFGYIVTATFLVAIVRQGGGSRLFEAAVWMVTGLAGLPSVFAWNLLVPRTGLAGAFALGCAVEATGVVASVGLPGAAGPLIGGAILGGTFIAITALGLQAGRRLAGEAPRKALALMTAIFGIGQVAGPLVAGVLADWSGSFVVASLLAALSLLAAALFAWQAGADPRLL